MIVAGLLLQLAMSAAPTGLVSAAPDVLIIRQGDRVSSIPIVREQGEPAVRAEQFVAPLGGTVRSLGRGRYKVSALGAEVELIHQLPFARVLGDVVPLANAPYTQASRLYLPLQLVTDVIPRAATNLMYDPERRELRVFMGTVSGGANVVTARDEDAPKATSRRATPKSPITLVRRHRVVVDAGHGGPDNGMTGPIGKEPKIFEKDITLEVATLVAEALRRRGVETLMTRTTDTLIALYDRGAIANHSKADLFLSIHVNAAPLTWKKPADARGFETYFLAEAKTEEAKRVEAMENSSVRFETGANAPKGDPLSFIINDMAQNEHLRESNELAADVQVGLDEIHPGPNRGVKQANFAVLRTSFMPAVLIEIGFGTNPAEAKYLADAAKQQKIADAIADATIEYLAGYERRTGAVTP